VDRTCAPRQRQSVDIPLTAACASSQALKRFEMPDEVASVAAMLASGEASYMTGAEVSIGGGLLAGSGATPE